MTIRQKIVGELKKRAIQLIEVVWYILVIVVLLIWVLPDFLPKRKR